MRFPWAGYYQTEGKRGQRNHYFWGIQGKAVAGAGVAGITSQVSNEPKTYRTPELSQISQSLTPSDVRYLFVRASFARSFVVVAESQNLMNAFGTLIALRQFPTSEHPRSHSRASHESGNADCRSSTADPNPGQANGAQNASRSASCTMRLATDVPLMTPAPGLPMVAPGLANCG